MKAIFLISSLGMSPGVVTGTIDALQYGELGESYNPKFIAIITTDNELTRLSLEVVEYDIKKNNPHIQVLPYIIKGLSDITTIEDNNKLMREFVSAVKEGDLMKKRGVIEEIHVNIAGGRKTMSGLFATLSNIFPVDMVYHLITTPEIEQQGFIKNFLNNDNSLNKTKLDSEASKGIFHPKTKNLPTVLVEIPILHSVNFDDLLELSSKIERNEAVSDHYLIELMFKQGILTRLTHNKYKITQKGRLLFELFINYKEK